MRRHKLVILFLVTPLILVSPLLAGYQKLTVSVISERYQIETLSDLARTFGEKHGIEVKIVDHTADVQTLMSTLFTREVDIIVGVPHDWLPGLVRAGSIHALNDYFDPEEVDSFLSLATGVWSLNQELYGIPISIDTSLLIVNESQVEQLPRTWDALVNIAKTKGFLFDAQTLEGIWPFFSAYGVSEGNLHEKTFQIAVAEAFEAIGFVQELDKEGIINVEYARRPDAEDFFRNEEVGMIIGGSWLLDDFSKEGLRVKAVPIPRPADDKIPKPFSFVDAIVLSGYSKNKKIAADFIRETTLVGNNFEKLWLGNFWAPSRKDILEQPWWQSTYPIAARIADQVEDSLPLPNMYEAGYSWEPVNRALSDILGNRRTEDEAVEVLEAAEDEVREDIKSFSFLR